MAPQQQPVWRICLGQLGPNLQEAAELANVLQEVSGSIQVTGLTRTLTARTSTSSGNPTHLSAKERIRRAVPLDIDAGCVPWSQLSAVVSSVALQEPNSPASYKQQAQVLEVNSGGAVFFLFFKLKPGVLEEQQLQDKQTATLQQQQQQGDAATREPCTAAEHQGQAGACTTQHAAAGVHAQAQGSETGSTAAQGSALHTASKQQSQPPQQACLEQQQQQQQPALPLLQLHQRHACPREGVAVLKIGASRLAMQAEQFANELTRHLGIAAPDCRIVRQVGSSAGEWSAVLAAVQTLAEPPPRTTHAATSRSSAASSLQAGAPAGCSADGKSSSTSTGTGGSSSHSGGGGCETAAELLAELSHLPCFLLMEFVEGSKLSDCPQAMQSAADAGQLCEDVGRLFLLDMLLGNADRMACPELGWRGNPNNLLYAMPGSRHSGRAVAIDSCVARRPPALKASAEDAAVERLSQLVLAVPGVSLALLRQLLGALKQAQLKRQHTLQRRQQQYSLPGAVGLCTELSMDSLAGSSSRGGQTTNSSGASSASGQHQASAARANLKQEPGSSNQVLGHSRACKTSLGSLRDQVQQAPAAEDGAGCTGDDVCFSDEEVARFQAGLRQCLQGVLQIKGLLEMVSAKVAEWIAEFVDDVVRLNPALLPNPASPGPGSLLRLSPKPSPRPSGRGSFSSIRLEPAAPPPPGGVSSSSSSLGGVQETAPAAAGGLTATPHNGSGSGSSSRMQVSPLAAAEWPPAKLRLRAAASPEPEAPANPAPQPPAAAAAPLSPAAQCRQNVASCDAAKSDNDAVDAVAGDDSSSSSGDVCTPPRGLLKQLVVGSSSSSKKDKAQVPLARRFAAIKAAICSPNHHHKAAPQQQEEEQQQQQHAQASSSVLPQPAAVEASPAAAAASRDTCRTPTAATQQPSSCSEPCSTPSTTTCGSRGGAAPLPGLEVSSGSTSDLATAVAAALSPRADALQAGALAGLFGGRSPSTGRLLHRSLNGTTINSSSIEHCTPNTPAWQSEAGAAAGCVAAVRGPPSLRRMTWCAADEPAPVGSGGAARGASCAVLRSVGGASILEPPAHKVPLPLSCGGAGCTPSAEAPLPAVAGWCSSPSAPAAALPRATGSATAKAQQHANSSRTNSSRTNSTSSPLPSVGAAVTQQHASTASPFGPLAVREGLPSSSPPPAAGSNFDSFLSRQHNTRHLSFTSGGGCGGEGGGGGSSSSSNSPAGMAMGPQQQQQQQQQQHRSSSSSLQVLASLQLDATLASITQEARHDGALAERLAQWKTKFKERGAKLSAAIAAFEQRHQLAAVLSTGFLDGSHPIVDAYELGVRLQHMLRRLTALAAGALVQAPIAVLPGVFLGNAVAADSHHLLQYLGVTHVLNAAQELQLMPDPAMFHVLRVAIQDEEEEDVADYFETARSWIDAALSSGGAVLVHCHEGKSRSVTLLLAYLMISRGLTLAAALQHMRAVHPKASPNAGFMAQLMRLDLQLHGACSIQPSELPRSKPDCRICSICGAAAGISYASLVRHTKAKHGLAKPPRAPATPAGAAAAAAAAVTPERRY